MYALSLIFQILTTGSFLRQTSTALVVLTALHLGLVAALGWALIANGLVSLQWVEDGTISSLAVSSFIVVTQPSELTRYISLSGASRLPFSLQHFTFPWTLLLGGLVHLARQIPLSPRRTSLFLF